MPDPLTVLNHCKTGALVESALKQHREKIRDKERTSRLVIGKTCTSQDAGSILIVQKPESSMTAGGLASETGLPEWGGPPGPALRSKKIRVD
jgi:hypothetical protein